MSLQKLKKTYGVFLAIIIGIIVISFVFTGINRVPTGGADTVAMVGDTPVKGREYQMAVEQFMQFANTYFGGKLSKEELEQQKRRVLERLIQGKMMLNIAERMDLRTSDEEVIKTVKSLPYFQTKQGFNLDMYKQALTYQGMTPTQFEESLAQDIKIKELSQLFQSLTVSKAYVDEIKKFKEQKYNVSALRFTKKPLEKFLSVSDSEINAFLKEPTNKAKVKSLFDSRKAQLDSPEQVKARHILIKVTKDVGEDKALNEIEKIRKNLTAKNFAQMADKFTQDPTGKGKGGSLGWFTHGRMVPEFEKEAFSLKLGTISEPVKTTFGYHLILVEDKKETKAAQYQDYEKKIAKEIIQSLDPKKLDQFVAQLESKLTSILSKGNKKELEEASQTYGVTLSLNTDLNLYDGTAGNITLDGKNVDQIFKHPNPNGQVFSARDASTITLIKVNSKIDNSKSEKNKDEKAKEVAANDSTGRKPQEMAMSEKLFQEVLRKEQENTKIKILKQI